MSEYRGFKTYYPKEKDIIRKWYLVDAEGLVLGRLASKITRVLLGKHKPEYYPGADVGDFIVVINADKVKITGKKLLQKKYYRHSGYPGGLKEIVLKDMLERHPERVLYLAVKRMLPKNRLGRRVLKRLKIYAGANHPHEAQRPEDINIMRI
jgi:large subunit ribosomal protein L13